MKKLELLRKLDTPKVGDIVTSVNNHITYKIEAIIGSQICVGTQNPIYKNDPFAYLTTENMLRQNPLFWLEDTPIYKGDIVYFNGRTPITVNSFIDNVFIKSEECAGLIYHISMVTLVNPKVKMTKWANIYNDSDLIAMHDTKKLADEAAFSERIACAEVSWEE